MIEDKCRNPINPGNRKVIVFTAFADTAHYLYEQLAPWAKTTPRHRHRAGHRHRAATRPRLPSLRKDLASILTAFSPRSKERPEDLAGEGELDLLIATDCISEGQNLQDCDWLINYDIHWNPVRIIQRFGRIDRIGSPNERIQLVNFWPNMELEEYINLEQRVSGRMVLLDISATGEENLIEQQSGNQMNDLEYRRKQLLKLQDAVIDLEDLSTGVSIADLTLTDFRIDLAQYLKAHPGRAGEPAARHLRGHDHQRGARSRRASSSACAPRARPRSAAPSRAIRSAPHYLVHVGDDGTVLLPYTQAKQMLDRLKRLCLGRDLPDAGACARFDKATKQGEDMRACPEAARRGRRLGRRQERRARRRQPVHARRHPRHEGRVRGHQRLRGRRLSRRAPGRRPHEQATALIDALGPARRQRASTSACPRSCCSSTVRRPPPTSGIISDGIEELLWVAALKPTTIGVPEYRDDVREYLEIAVLRVTLRAGGKATRLIELIHRAVPYPLLLLTAQGERRRTFPPLTSAGRRARPARRCSRATSSPLSWTRRAMANAGLPSAMRSRLATNHAQRSMRCIRAGSTRCWLCRRPASPGPLRSAPTPNTRPRGATRSQECARLDAEIDRLRATAAKEKQMARRVELNLELKRVEAAQAAARANL